VTLVGERPGVKLAISVPAKSEPPWDRATVLGVYHSDHKGLVGLCSTRLQYYTSGVNVKMRQGICYYYSVCHETVISPRSNRWVRVNVNS